MGTSQASRGPSSGVPMVPPWVPDPILPDGQNAPNPPQQLPLIAPSGRFGPSRSSLGRYAQSGSSDDMRRGLGHYVGRGLGGASTAARRFGGTARTAGGLYGALSATASDRAAEQGSPLDPTLLRGRSASEVMDAVVEVVRPTDGTQDTEASRRSIKDALSELLNRFPNADLLNLSEDQRLFAIERYVGFDIYARFRLDVGKAIQDKAPSATAALARLKNIKEYIKEAVAREFRQLHSSGQSLNARHIVDLVNQTLYEAFHVFEDYNQ
ncbi:MAG: hypothetical protein HND46_18450 [Chloroflexi bacterium]|nr:hypothetical protein [Chloroflexota bacterium]NOG65402.1 hypothetical protein [Chloroflexota bacterium]